jgi:hypothetical protein
MTSIPAQPTSEDNLAAIEGTIRVAFATIAPLVADHRDAKELAKNLGDKAEGKRETLALALANAARNGAWSDEDTEACVAKIFAEYAGTVKAKNRTEEQKKKAATVATFKSEVTLVTARAVRDHVSQGFAIVAAAWNAEEDAKLASGDKKFPTPLRRWHKRRYHATLNLFRAIKADENGARKVRSPADFVAFTTRLLVAEKIRFERVADRLKVILDELESFNGDFGMEDIDIAVEHLRKIDADAIKAAHTLLEKQRAAIDAALPEMPVAPVAPEAPEPAPQPGEPSTEFTDALRYAMPEAAD